ncbi:MAG TPA: glycosyltransferase family 1 protein, partial [Beijerinckiaceae bacterium]|nr:glycosyltransferase family 1 protein [Beijerinckiaceae bacterium]
MSERRIVFVAQDGAAVPPLAEAARAVGLEPVVVAARGLDAVERAGLRLVRLDSAPSLNPVTAGYGAGRLAAFLRH